MKPRNKILFSWVHVYKFNVDYKKVIFLKHLNSQQYLFVYFMKLIL